MQTPLDRSQSSCTNTLTLSDVSERLQYEFDHAFAARCLEICKVIWSNAPTRILDAGCGRGFYATLFAHAEFSPHVYALEQSVPHLQVARTLLAENTSALPIAGSCVAVPLSDSSIECVVCSEVLEHIPDEAAAIGEFARVLEPHGTLLVTVPSSSFPLVWDPVNALLMRLCGIHLPRSIHWLGGIWADHIRLYSPESLRAALEPHFELVEIRTLTSWSWPFAHHLLYGIGKPLVEALGLTFGNRFASEPPGPGAKCVAALLALPNKLLPQREAVGVNLIAIARKR